MSLEDFGVHFDTIFLGVNAIVECSKVAERYDLKVWVADEGHWAETFTILAAIAAKTGVRAIGSNVTHPYGRSPITIANSTSTIVSSLATENSRWGSARAARP